MILAEDIPTSERNSRTGEGTAKGKNEEGLCAKRN